MDVNTRETPFPHNLRITVFYVIKANTTQVIRVSTNQDVRTEEGFRFTRTLGQISVLRAVSICTKTILISGIVGGVLLSFS